MKAGDLFYVAYPDSVASVRYMHDGTDRNFKHAKRDPVTCMVLDGLDKGSVGCFERDDLFVTSLAAAVRSAEMARKLDEEG